MEIQGWDYAPSNCRTTYNPIFYFTPDADFLSYLKINGPLHIPIIIHDTIVYDGFYYVRIDKQPETTLYVGFLPTVFGGFPPTNGAVELSMKWPVIPAENGPLWCVQTGCC